MRTHPFLLLACLAGIAACGSKPVTDASDDTGEVPDEDRDGDGFVGSEDCDDSDADVFPGAVELCDGIDNDCDGELDNVEVDLPAWYTDSDGDGYGDDSTLVEDCDQPSGLVGEGGDCDDTNASIHPGATELCNGIDDDCDAGTGEEGTVAFVTTDGVISDMTTEFTSGAAGAGAEIVLTEDGHLHVCEGSFQVNVTVEANVGFEGLSGDATTAVLDGAQSGATIFSQHLNAELSFADLTVTGGSGADPEGSGYTMGGGIVLNTYDSTARSYAMGTVSLDNVVVHGNSADMGGGLVLIGANSTIENSEIRNNHSTIGYSGMVLGDGAHHLEGVDIIENTSDGSMAGGAVFANQASYVHSFVDVRFIDNQAFDYTAALYLQMNSVVWSGSGAGSSAVLSNTVTDHYSPTAAVDLNSAYLEVDNVDFGAPGSSDDNGPADLQVVGTNAQYWAPDGATFSCDPTGCGEPVSYDLGDSNNGEVLVQPTKVYAQVIQASSTTTATLEQFGFQYIRASATGCTMNMRVATIENASSEAQDWDVLWSSTGNAVQGSSMNLTDAFGILIEPDNFYALIISPVCSSNKDYVIFGYTTSPPNTDAGFGTSVGWAHGNDSSNSTISLTYVPAYDGPFDTQVSVVEIQ